MTDSGVVMGDRTPSVNTTRPPPPDAVDESAPLRTQLVAERDRSGSGGADGSACCGFLGLKQHPGRGLWLCIGALVIAGLIAALVVATRHSATAAETEREYEQQFVDGTSQTRLREHLQYYTNESHIAGSVMDYERALYTQRKMQEYGLPNVEIERFNVLLSYPISRRLRIVSGAPAFEASLKETVLPYDKTSGKPSVDTFLSYSASGNVTAPLVYTNYGRLSDYEALAAKGVSVVGCVVIARYGQIFRGNIVSNAEYHGAVGVIIYSDPADDGITMGGVYPNAPGWRPPQGVQRGTIWNGNGDPLTPGYPSTDSAPRISMAQAGMANYSYGTPLSKIPSVPIGYGDAEPLLAALGGAAIPDRTWQGGLNITYHVGPGPVRVNLDIVMSPERRDIWNVVARIPGSVEPDRYVVLGNHRDAWTFGAGDPNSGSAALLEVAYGYGQLLQSGWQPRRSIWLCSWDAEEYALIGSVEHCELHEKQLMAGAVAYLNVDVGVSTTGLLAMQGVPSLVAVTRAVAAGLAAPSDWRGGGHTLLGMWQASQGIAPESSTQPVLAAGSMGTGSDYGGFMQHLGIPALDARFQNYPNSYSGVYHSNYDSFSWLTSPWADPAFAYHQALTRLWGVLAMRLADSPLLPLLFTEYANALVSDVQSLVQSYSPQQTGLNFTDLLSAANACVRTATRLDAALLAMGSGTDDAGNGLTDMQLRLWNDKLTLAERAFLYLQGMPGREWYRHVVWVSGVYDVYGSTAFASIVDAMAVNDVSDAQIQIQMAALALQNFNDFLQTGQTF